MSPKVRIWLFPCLALLGCDAIETGGDGQSTPESLELAEAAEELACDDDTVAVGEETDALAAALTPTASEPATADTLLVPPVANWRYLVQPYLYSGLPCVTPANQMALTWKDRGYDLEDPTVWGRGPAELGYGDNDEQTVITFGSYATRKCITQYFRTTFYIGQAEFKELILRLLVDDGAVVYINGVEVHRTNLPWGAIGPDTKATKAVEGSAEDRFVQTKIPLASVPLYAEDNVLAIEVHQYSQKDPDASLNAELVGVLEWSSDLTTLSYRSEEATIDEDEPNTALGKKSTCQVDGRSGSDNTGGDQACLARWTFDGAWDPPIPSGAVVHGAYLKTEIVNASPDRYQLFPLNTAWIEDKVTWNDPDGWGGGDWPPSGAPKHPFSIFALVPPPVTVVNALNTGVRIIPLPNELVQGWIDDPWSNNGVAVFNSDHANGLGFDAVGPGLELVVTFGPPQSQPAPLP